VLALDECYAREYIAAGANFVAIGTDVGLLNAAASKLIMNFKNPLQGPTATESR